MKILHCSIYVLLIGIVLNLTLIRDNGISYYVSEYKSHLTS